MEYKSKLRIKKLEDKLACYREDNTNLQIVIKLKEFQMESKEMQISDQKNCMKGLFAQIDELRDEKQLNQKLQSQNFNRKFNESKVEGEITHLNKLLIDKDKVIMQSQKKI